MFTASLLPLEYAIFCALKSLPRIVLLISDPPNCPFTLDYDMSKPKREDIQGLRAVAIIMVLLFHFFPGQFPNGYVGVDMFFVISGYIISMVFPKELSAEKIVDFYYRRVKRILPLYFTTILAVLIATVLFAPQNFVEVNMASGQRAILLISNIMSATSAELDYKKLIDNAEDLFTHCWSLCLEMQWYLLAPVIFFFKSSRIIFCQAVLVTSAIHYITTDESTEFNCVFARLWQFLAGILAHEFVRHMPTSEKVPLEDDDRMPLVQSPSRSNSANDILAVLSQIFVLSMVLGFLPMEHHPTILRGIMTVSTAALLLSGAVTEAPLLSSSVLSWIGNVSYSLYLVHWPIYITAKQYGSTTDLFLGLAVSVAVAALVYYFFEQKYLTWEKIFILLFVAGVFASALFTSIEGAEMRQKINGQPSAHEIATSNNTDMPWLAINMAEGGMHNTSNNLYSSLCKYESILGIPTKPPFGHCEMPNGNGSYNMLVLGNSWAANQGEMVYKAFGKYAKTFDVYSRVGCEPLQHAVGWCTFKSDYGREAVELFKPDVLFLLHRVISTTPKINVTVIDDDPIFMELLGNLRFYEQFAKKIYIQQALPWCTIACTSVAVNAMMKERKNLTEIGDRFIRRDEHYARIRIAELAKRCKNCELIDFLPRYPLGPNGKPTFYVFEKNLIMLDNEVHLNKFGKERMQPVFDDLAKHFHL